MQGKKSLSPQLFYQVSLDQLVPEDNFYRQLGKALDLGYLYKATAAYYGREGQQSIDPIVFFKILLVGYLNNINSDRALIRFCADRLGIRLFLGYDLQEQLPCHSTISRTRQLYGEETFLQLFQQVLKMCIDKGMVRGKRQCVDSAFIKANASMDSLVEKEILDDASAFVDEFDENSEFKVATTRKKLVDQHHAWKAETFKDMPGASTIARFDEDGKWYPSKVPDQPHALQSHWSRCKDQCKARQLNYAGQIAVDDAHHVITGAVASTAGTKDSMILPEIVDQTIENLKDNFLQMDELVADAGYSSWEALQYLEHKNINAWIPNFGQYKFEREGFFYNEELDQYKCVKEGGNHAVLPFKKQSITTKGHELKSYRSSETDCKTCPLREQCIGSKTAFKKINHTIHKPLYDKMHRKISENKSYHRWLVKRRSSAVEPVLGTLINFHNMQRINSRGMDQARKHVLMAALTYNLKKYLKFTTRKALALVMAMEIKSAQAFLFLLQAAIVSFFSFRVPQK